MVDLKLSKLPDRTPVKLAIAISPELMAALTDYAAIYAQTYGAEESIANLVPAMLQSFLQGDRGFVRARSAVKPT